MRTYLILGAIIACLAGGFAYSAKQAIREHTLREIAVQSFDDYSKAMQQQAIEDQAKLNRISSSFQEARDVANEKTAVFDDKNMARIVEEKPEWFAHLANDATRRLYDEIERASGGGAARAGSSAPGRDTPAKPDVDGRKRANLSEP